MRYYTGILATKSNEDYKQDDDRLSQSRTRFGEQTFGNCIAFTIDGQETFRQIIAKMHQAKRSIYIINYDITPALQFVRNPIQYHSFLIQKKRKESSGGRGGDGNRHSTSPNDASAEEVNLLRSYNSTATIHPQLISSHCRKPMHYESSTSGSNNNSSIQDVNIMDGHNLETHSLQEILFEKAKEGVEIKIIVWQPRLIFRMLPGADKRGIEGRVGEIEQLRELAKKYGLQEKLQIRVDDTAPALTSAHHEKIIIVDNEFGFCGGLDLSHGKWDTSDHAFENPLRDVNAEPWHDIHAMVRGPVIWDLLYHFNQRWIYSVTKDLNKVVEIGEKMPLLFSHASEPLYSINTGNNNIQSNDGNISIRALRTWEPIDSITVEANNTTPQPPMMTAAASSSRTTALAKEEEDEEEAVSAQGGRNNGNGNTTTSSTIFKWYAETISNAKTGIYIENQFPFEDKHLTQILIKRLKEEPNLKVIIVGPVKPNLPGLVGSLIVKMSVNDVNENLKELRNVGQDRIQTYCLISQHPEIAERRRQIYVHSKVMIVDDKWVTIGSANTDKKGMKDSTEFNLAIDPSEESSKLIRKLRIRLWQEHLGYFSSNRENSDMQKRIKDIDYVNDDYGDGGGSSSLVKTLNLAKFEDGFEAMRQMAAENASRVLNNKPIKGHLYFYDFEEKKFPPPYPEAKGDTKFKFA